MSEVYLIEETDVTPRTTEEFLQEPPQDRFWKKKAWVVGQSGSKYESDRYRFAVRSSFFQYWRLTELLGDLKMYYTVRRKYHWPHMSNGAISTVRGCLSYAWARGISWNHQNHLKLFPEPGNLKFVSMDLFWSVIVRFSNFVRFLVLHNTNAVVFSNAFWERSLYASSSLADVFTDKSGHFGASLLDALRARLGG